MFGQLIRQIHSRVGWPVALAVAVTVLAFGIATAFVAQRSDETSTIGVATSGGRAGDMAGGLVAPEERMKAGTSAVAPAPSQSANGVDGGTGTSIPALEAGRDVVRTGSVDIEVRSVTESFEQVRTIATGAGGFVADSMFVGGGDDHSARLTLRVPADRFGEVVTHLRGLATDVRSISSNSRDVTGETNDLEATLKNLRAVEAQYATLLGRSGSIGDILQVQERLNQVRLQIDRTEARRALIQSQTEMSTLTVALLPEGTGVSGTGPRAAAVEAWEASLDTLENIATAAIVVAVYSWWIVPLIVAGVVVLRRRTSRRPAIEAPPAV